MRYRDGRQPLQPKHNPDRSDIDISAQDTLWTFSAKHTQFDPTISTPSYFSTPVWKIH